MYTHVVCVMCSHTSTGLELQEYETKRAEAAAAAAEEEAAAAAAAGAAADSGELLPLRESSGAIRQLKRNATGALEQVSLARHSTHIMPVT